MMSNLNKDEQHILRILSGLVGTDKYHEISDAQLKFVLDLYNKEVKISHYLQSELDMANAKIFEFNKQMDLDYVEKNYIHKDKIREILKYYRYTPANNPNTIIVFYSDIKKLLEE